MGTTVDKIPFMNGVIRIAILCTVMSLNVHSYAQIETNAVFDSLWAEKMLDVAYSLEIENPDSALAIYSEIISNTPSIPYAVAQGKGHLYSGIVHSDQGQYDEATKSYLTAIDVFKTVDHLEGIGSAYINLGNIQNRKAQYGKAIAYYLDGVRIFESMSDTLRMIYAYTNIGSTLSEVEQFERSLVYNRKSLALSRTLGDSLRVCNALINIGLFYIKTDQPDSAKEIYTEASELGEAYGDEQILYLINNNWSTIYSNQSQFEEALMYADKSLKYAERLNNPVYMSNAHGAIGQAFFNLDRLDSAKYHINLGLEMAEENESVETYMMGLEKMAVLEETSGNTAAALSYLKKLKELEEEDTRARQKKVIAGLEIEYETEKKDLAISEKNLEIEKNQALLAKRNTLIAGLISALILTILIFFLVRRSLQQKKKIAEQEASLNNEKLIKLAKEKEVDNLKSMLEGEDKERTRLAKDLHDGLGGMLSATRLRFNKIQLNHQNLSDSEDYNEALQLIDRTSQEARRISHNLMPGALEKFGLKEALSDFCQNIESSSGIEVSLQILNMAENPDKKLEKNLYRIIQELVNNALKH
ncbi:MAG: tetratricopeptide repeat protein, partial [Cryomorphaceae bacterium]